MIGNVLLSMVASLAIKNLASSIRNCVLAEVRSVHVASVTRSSSCRYPRLAYREIVVEQI